MNKKIQYELWTDKRGKFGAIVKGSDVFEIADTNMFAKIKLDERSISVGMTEEYLQEWIQDFIDLELLDSDGNYIEEEL